LGWVGIRDLASAGPDRGLAQGGPSGVDQTMATLPVGISMSLLVALLIGPGPLLPGLGPAVQARDSRQHLVVITEGPGRIQGLLYRMQRVPGAGSGAEGTDGGPSGDAWRQVGPPVVVVVGRSGVGPKKEGDGRAPQGAFPLGPAFGYASEPPPDVRIPYQAMVPGALCVDDTESAFYNLVLDPDTVPGAKDWTSAEVMRRDVAPGDDLYRFGVIVQYNPRRVPGAGSCIFLHVWRDSESPTAGCTAMAEENLLEVLRWLDPEAGPVLIQGDRVFLEGLREEGHLPYPVPGSRIPHRPLDPNRTGSALPPTLPSSPGTGSG